MKKRAYVRCNLPKSRKTGDEFKLTIMHLLELSNNYKVLMGKIDGKQKKAKEIL